MIWRPRTFGQKFFIVSGAVVFFSGMLTIVLFTVLMIGIQREPTVTAPQMDHAVHDVADRIGVLWDRPNEWRREFDALRKNSGIPMLRLTVVDFSGHARYREGPLYDRFARDGRLEADEMFGMLAGKERISNDLVYVVAPVSANGRPVGFIAGDVAHFPSHQPRILTLTSIFVIPTAVTVLVSILASLYLTRLLKSRLSQLTTAIRAMAQGDYYTRLIQQSDDEVGQVARAFNQMADRLEQARRQEKELERLKTELITNVSHDLRGPLTSLEGYLEALEDGVAGNPETAARYVGIIRKKSRQLSQLVEDLLEYSRLESGHLPMRLAALEVSDWLRESLAVVEPDIAAAGLELVADIPENTGTVRMDAKKMDQVVANLVQNAAHYAPAGSRLSVSLMVSDGRAVIRIADQGAGIDPRDLPMLFERFFRGRNQADGVGTGLGLSIAAHIVRAHGGSIWAENGANGGAVFSFSIPIEATGTTELIMNMLSPDGHENDMRGSS